MPPRSDLRWQSIKSKVKNVAKWVETFTSNRGAPHCKLDIRIARVAARVLSVLAVLVYTAFATATLAFGQTATVAGFAFGGDFSTAKERFPVAYNAINGLAANDASGIQALSRKVVQIARATKTGGGHIKHRHPRQSKGFGPGFRCCVSADRGNNFS